MSSIPDSLDIPGSGCPCGAPEKCTRSADATGGSTATAASSTTQPAPASPGVHDTADADTDTTTAETRWGDLEADTPETDTPDEILDRAQDLDYDRAFALVSGGHDSMTAAYYVYHESPIDLDGWIHIDTGVGLPETQEFVIERAADLEIPLHIVSERREADEYETRIQKYGFPGANKTSHRWEWVNNKDKPLQNFLQKWGDVLLVSGATRHESEARWESVNANGIERKEGHTYISPLAGWTPLDVRRYRRENNLPANEVIDILEHSGDCFCGCYGDRKELEWLHEVYPHMWIYLQSLESKVIDAARNGDLKKDEYRQYQLWGHGSMTDREVEQRLGDREMTLCQSCNDRGDTTPGGDTYQTLTEAALQLDEADLPDSPTAFRDAFDVTQEIPEDVDNPIEYLRRAYEAFDEIAERLGYDDHKDLVQSKYEEKANSGGQD